MDFTKLSSCCETYPLVEVDGVFAGDDVVDGAALGGRGLLLAGGGLLVFGHGDCGGVNAIDWGQR